MDKFWAPQQEQTKDGEDVKPAFEFVDKKAFYMDKLNYDLGAWVQEGQN